ncbi:hypothetical protein DdX_20466 [Ditylenchus destructor]|uniref:Uncharacterized protein n=1 Tax=Ditylenchus destructor TaxID=166010 RepID=A0AAD4MGL1_9BILA|nr:hypothetical protein DdX_20466 [Ditylenchus destructor]
MVIGTPHHPQLARGGGLRTEPEETPPEQHVGGDKKGEEQQPEHRQAHRRADIDEAVASLTGRREPTLTTTVPPKPRNSSATPNMPTNLPKKTLSRGKPGGPKGLDHLVRSFFGHGPDDLAGEQQADHEQRRGGEEGRLALAAGGGAGGGGRRSW